MLRAIILGLVLFLALGAIVPVATEYTSAVSVKQQKRKYKKKRRAKKYRRYRKYRRSSRSQRLKRYRRSIRRCSKYRKAPSCKRFWRWYKARRLKNSKRRYRSSAKYRKKRKRKTRRYKRKRRARTAKRYRKSTRKYRKKRTRRYKKKRRYTARKKVSKKRRVRRHSKKWWRAYRARKARQRAIAKRKRSLRLRRIRLAKKRRASKSRNSKRRYRASTRRKAVAPKKAAVLPSGKQAPMGWVQGQADSRELQFKVDGENGSQIGSASLTVLGPAMGKSTKSWRSSSVGGVSTTTLRRTVIDRMIRENGWVENDYEKEIGGRKVYVVVAKSPDASNRVQSRTFYFTEANGRIYSLATKSSKQDSKKIVKQSEKVIESLQTPEKRVQQAQKQ